METVQVAGRFVDKHKIPVPGYVKFVPQRLWVEHEGKTYPTMGHEEQLTNGMFIANLTRTDTEETPWMYQLHCPLGIFHVSITSDGPIHLKDILPKRYV